MKLLLFLSFFFLSIIVAPLRAQAALGDVPEQNLLGHWTFNESSGTVASDSSSNNLNATLVNQPSWVAGLLGSALQFTAASGSANSYVTFPSSLQSTNFPTSGSLSFWINGDFTTQDNKCILDCWSSRNHIFVIKRLGGVQIVLQETSGQYLNQKGSSQYVNSAITNDITRLPIANNTWTHIAVVWDSTNKIGYIYKNGVMAASFFWGGYNSSWAPSAQVFKINDAISASSETIDDVALYNRPLAASEIEAIYSGNQLPSVDVLSPSSPVNLAGSSLSSDKVALGWNPAIDDTQIAGYVVYRNNTPIAQVNSQALAYTDTGLAPATTYTYNVYAYDTFGNRSEVSASTTAATLSNPHILFQSDFEQNALFASASIGGWTQNGPNDQAVQATTEMARAGVKSTMFDFNYSDWDGTDTNNHERAQIRESQATSLNLDQTYWVGLSHYIPSSWEDDLSTNAELLWQFHGADNGPGASSPPLALYIGGDTARLSVRGDPTTYYVTAPSEQVLASFPLQEMKGQWVDWVIQTRFSFTDGMVKVWKNGTLVVDYSGPTIYHSQGETNQNGTYLTLGVYKWGWGDSATQVSNRKVFFDEVRIGDSSTSCADVKPAGSLQCENVADITPPSVVVTSPLNEANVSGQVTIQANASDDTDVERVEFYVDNSLIATRTSSPYSITWDTTAFAHNSSHTIRAKAYDTSGNVSTSSPITINVLDITNPSVAIIAPLANTTVNRRSTVTIAANATDASGISKVEFYVNDSLSCTDVTTPFTCVWVVPNGKNITYSLQAKSYDVAGNSNSSIVQVTSK